MSNKELWWGRCDNCLGIGWENIKHGFKSIKKYHTLRNFKCDNIEEICIAVSPDYLSKDLSYLCKQYDFLFNYEDYFI